MISEILLPEWMKDTKENRDYFNRVLDGSIQEIVQDVDGFYYYQPTTSGGLWDGTSLKIIAYILDELNKSYEKTINEFFAGSGSENDD